MKHIPWLKGLILTLLIGWLGFNLVDVTVDTLRPTGGIDIFTYWAVNLYTWSGSDPFVTFFTGQPLPLPFQHLNGWTTVLDSQYPALFIPLPTALPLLVAVLAPLSLVTWPVAKVIFLVVNLGLMFTIPWLTWVVVRPTGVRITLWSKWLLALVFYGMLATRNTLSNGQQSILVLWAALLGLLLAERKSPAAVIGAGVLLGLAFSKYTLAFPFLLFLLYKRYFKVLLIALGTQLAGGVALAALVPVSPIVLLRSSLAIFVRSTTAFSQVDWGIGFADFLATPWTAALVISNTLLVGLFLVRCVRGRPAGKARFLATHVLAVLVLWSLTIVHHGYYDAVSVIIALALLLIVVEQPAAWGLRPLEHRSVIVLLVIATGVLLLPGASFGRFVPGIGAQWGALTRLSGLIVIVLLQYGTVWLLGRSALVAEKRRHYQNQTGH